MESDFQRAVSLRPSRRVDRDALIQRAKDREGGMVSPGRLTSEHLLKTLWKKGFIRLLLVAGMVWMLLILFVLLVHIWSCQSSVAFFSA